MRCREALNRLNRLDRSTNEPDRELLEHLKSCPECARQAEAARELREVLAEMSADDEVDRITWPEQIRRVEAAAARAYQNQPREIPIMSAMKRQLKLRPRLSAGLAAALAVLLAGTLIPFKFDQTVGFEVAVAGVDRDLALNESKLQELQQYLTQLGLTAARIDVTGCQTTCNLVVSNLASSEDADVVANAFRQIAVSPVISINQIKEEVSGSTLRYAMRRIFIFESGEHYGEDGPTTKSFFFVDEESGDTARPVSGTWLGETPGADSGTDAGALMYIAEYDVPEFEQKAQQAVSETPLPHLEDRHLLNDTLTDAARAEFAAQGWKVELSEDKKTVTFSRIGDTDQSDVESQEAAKEAALPEGYSLSQNYPNPFNPDTRLDYTVPRSEHVTIDIFNINGQKVRTLVDETVAAGQHSVVWDAKSDSGERVASGVYLYRLVAGEVVASKKMTLVK